jgi:hypothetical protein
VSAIVWLAVVGDKAEAVAPAATAAGDIRPPQQGDVEDSAGAWLAYGRRPPRRTLAGYPATLWRVSATPRYRCLAASHPPFD